MNRPIYPCLWFDGKAKAAAQFYTGVFKHSRITIDTPMVVNFEINGQKIMGLNGGPMFQINPSISFFVRCQTLAETQQVWHQLLAGGSVMMPLNKYPWSEQYGWLKDQFGMTWQISYTPDTQAQTLIPSLLFTGHRFGQAEAAVRFYTGLFRSSAIKTLQHYPDADYPSSKVLFSEFNLGVGSFIAMDGPGEHSFTFNEGLSFVVECETQEEIDFYWDALVADGGAESRCGWLRDGFGVSWQIVPTVIGQLMSDPARAARVMEALMPMNKIVIEKLTQA